jgi:hypothetical protein
MKNLKIYSLDLNHDGQNYASFSGYVLAEKAVTNEQLNSIIMVKFKYNIFISQRVAQKDFSKSCVTITPIK